MEQIYSDLIGKKKSKSSNSAATTRPIQQDFHGYELLLIKRLQNDPAVRIEWGEKLILIIEKLRNGEDGLEIGEIPHHLWYLAVTLDRKRERLYAFIQHELQKPADRLATRETLLSRYMNHHVFTELHLDGIFKYGDDNTLPKELFKCSSVRWLSLKYNYLDKIPPDIGRMKNLEHLALTNNKLQNKSLPFTLTFCTNLRALMLDNNLLDALPGFLLKMHSLDTVHRHGNHNYFKSTFMWYHTDVNERILETVGVSDFCPREPQSMQYWAAKAVIGLKLDFFADDSVTPMLKDYIADIYTKFNVCGLCNATKLCNKTGFKVITFKNPYLGNTCVPFQHWACSRRCAMNIEVPAREEQIAAARDLDRQYDAYIKECQKQYNVTFSNSPTMSIRRANSRSPSSPPAPRKQWRRRHHKLNCAVS